MITRLHSKKMLLPDGIREESIYLESGKIVEDGTYEELIALNGRFAALVERQRLDN